MNTHSKLIAIFTTIFIFGLALGLRQSDFKFQPVVPVLGVGDTSGISIRIVSPNGGEVLSKGSSFPISWSSSSNIDKVSLGYSYGPGSLNWIANNIPNTNHYLWNVNVGQGSSYPQVKIYIIGYQTGVGSTWDYSDDYFSVQSPIIVTPTTTPTLTPTPTSRKICPSVTCTPGKKCIQIACPIEIQ